MAEDLRSYRCFNKERTCHANSHLDCDRRLHDGICNRTRIAFRPQASRTVARWFSSVSQSRILKVRTAGWWLKSARGSIGQKLPRHDCFSTYCDPCIKWRPPQMILITLDNSRKMVGRWRSGCPLALSPDRDDTEISKDPHRTNAFAYHDDDPKRLRTPGGSHIRRVNPRDALADSIVNTRLHRIFRRGATYGPMLPEGLLEDDGVARGTVIAFANANPGRQFEFVQSQGQRRRLYFRRPRQGPHRRKSCRG